MAQARTQPEVVGQELRARGSGGGRVTKRCSDLRGTEGDPEGAGTGEGTRPQSAGPGLRGEGPPLLVCVMSSSLTSSLGLTMGRVSAHTAEPRPQPSKCADGLEGSHAPPRRLAMYVPLSEADGLWQPPGKRKPALLGCHPAVVVPQAMPLQAAALSDGVSPMPAGRPAPAGHSPASPHSSPQPTDIHAAGHPQGTLSLIEVTWLAKSTRARVVWADRSARHTRPSVCRLPCSPRAHRGPVPATSR